MPRSIAWVCDAFILGALPSERFFIVALDRQVDVPDDIRRFVIFRSPHKPDRSLVAFPVPTGRALIRRPTEAHAREFPTFHPFKRVWEVNVVAEFDRFGWKFPERECRYLGTRPGAMRIFSIIQPKYSVLHRHPLRVTDMLCVPWLRAFSSHRVDWK